MRKIHISNDAKRDAEVAFGTTFHRMKPVYKTAKGAVGKNERRLKTTMATTDAALLAAHGEALTDALITSVLKVAVGGHIYGVWNIAWDIE